VVTGTHIHGFSLGLVMKCRQDSYKSEILVDATNEQGGAEVQLQTLCNFAANKFHISGACTVSLELVKL
jgi:hypothetical protein